MTAYAASAPMIGDATKATIQAWWTETDADRRQSLDTARKCAALTKSWILPSDSREKDAKLADKFQSIGARGVNNTEGLMLLALVPPDTPWHELRPSTKIMYATDIPPEILQSIMQDLFRRDLMVDSLLESAGLYTPTNRRVMGFRANKRMALSQIITTGDALERVNDDYTISVFRRTAYVVQRDCAGNVLCNGTCERIDPLTLTEELLAQSRLDIDDLRRKSVKERMRPLYTRVEWHPWSKKWVTTQELNGHQIGETSEDKISRFINTAYELAPEDDYGHGLVEQNLGDLRALDNLMERLLDFAATFSKQTPTVDYDAPFRESDFTKPTGYPIRARVVGGQVQDVAMFAPQNAPQFQMVSAHAAGLTKELAKAFLIESEVQPQGERVTATQIQRIAMELEGTLGGVYASIAEQQQLPLLRRVLYQMDRDRIMPPLPDELVEIKALTGLLALRRETERQRLLTIPQLMAGLSDRAKQMIDERVLVRAYARYSGIYEPGLILDDKQLEAQDRRALAMQAASQSIEKGVDVAGNVAQQQLTAPPGSTN